MCMRYLFPAFLLLLSGCCPDVECDGGFSRFYLAGFRPEETMDLRLYKVSPNTSIIDSAVVTVQSENRFMLGGDSVFEAASPIHILLGSDTYLLKGSAGKYVISHLTIRESECSKCFPAGYTHYDALGSYHVNGVLMPARGYLLIRK